MSDPDKLSLSELADEIRRRGLKFADVPPGQLSGDEIEAICFALDFAYTEGF